MNRGTREPTAAAHLAQCSELLGLPRDARVLIINADDFGMYHAVNTAVIRSIEEGIASETGELFTPAQLPGLLAQARLDQVELEFRAQINAVAAAGPIPTHLDWHCLADGGRDDIFDLTVALASEYGLAVRAWLEPARHKLRQRNLPVVDHDFLDSFSLDIDGKSGRYAELLRALPSGLSEWAVHPALGDRHSQMIDPGWRVRQTDYEFLTSPLASMLVRDERIVVIDYRTIQQAWSCDSGSS